jgi:endonuclease/exonuclease/phosphatase family metal-dependent hydrolase
MRQLFLVIRFISAIAMTIFLSASMTRAQNYWLQEDFSSLEWQNTVKVWIDSCNAVAEAADTTVYIPTNALKVVSFNIRQSGADSGVNKWDNRKAACKAMINDILPDIFGLQEAKPVQVNYMKDNLPMYSVWTAGRDNGGSPGEGENCSVFYRRARFDFLEGGHFWLSETPDEPSIGWDAAFKRLTSWVKLEEKASGRVLFFFNTHLDHASTKARRLGCQLIVARAKVIAGDSTIVVTGDFNMQADAANIKSMFDYFSSVRDTAPVTDSYGTTNAFTNPNTNNIIDFIFYRHVTPLQYKTIRNSYEGVTFISDHYPILGIFQLD